MSKRQVQFSENEPDKISYADDQDPKRFKEMHSLDSDEDDNVQSNLETEALSNRLTEDDIEGQEDETIRFDGEIRVTPFNLREEMEEGHFDAEGNYIANKDGEDIHDEWLDSVNWKKVGEYESLPKNDEDEEIEENDPFDRTKYLKAIVEIINPGESVLSGLRRLGGKKSSSTTRWKRNQKSIVEKKENEKKNESSGVESGKNTVLMLKLTELADRLLSEGDFEIYQKTFEKLNYELKELQEKHEDADEDDELEAAFSAVAKEDKSKEESTVTSKNCNALLDDEVMWEYKLEKHGAETLYGPYSSQQMLDWSQQGYFEQDVLCRKIGSGGDFYNAKRIDFELYT